MTKTSDYDRSVWSGQKYSRSQTVDDLTAESKTILRKHPTIGRAMKCDDETMRRLFGKAFTVREV
jgi:hypothetical protein